jgi:hypothetical protein
MNLSDCSTCGEISSDAAMLERAGVVERTVAVADWTLRAAILLHALGLARALFTRAGSSLGTIALMDWGVAHETILSGEMLFAALILAAAVSIMIRPTIIALLGIASMVLLEACAGVKVGGFPFYELTPYANALRYLAPLALIPLLFFRGPVGIRTCSWILRAGLAVVFAIHGYEAWRLDPRFIDYIIGSGRNLGSFEISEDVASSLLRVIGMADVVVAALILVTCSRWLLAWLCIWALVTALSRPVSLGFQSYPEVLLRASHFLAPVALWWLAKSRHRTRDHRLESLLT